MAKNRYINTCIWDDSYFCELDPTEKLVFVYLLTNTLTSICGVYEITFKRMAFDTGIDKEMLRKILIRFDNMNKIRYIDGKIVIKNFIQHQTLNPKVLKGIKAQLKKLPEEIIRELNLNNIDI